MTHDKLKKIWWIFLLIINTLYFFARNSDFIQFMKKYDVIFVMTFIFLVFYPLISEIKIGSFEIKKEIDNIKDTFLEQIKIIRKDFINMENKIIQSNGQNVNINYEEPRIVKNDNEKGEDFNKVSREYIIKFSKHSEEVLKAVDMKDFSFYTDTYYYENLWTGEEKNKDIFLYTKLKTEIRDLIYGVTKLLDIDVVSIIDGLDKIESIGILEEKDMTDLKNGYLLLFYADLGKNKYIDCCNYITNILPPILYKLQSFYDNYSSFMELSQEKRKQEIIELKKRNEEDSYWLED